LTESGVYARHPRIAALGGVNSNTMSRAKRRRDDTAAMSGFGAAESAS